MKIFKNICSGFLKLLLFNLVGLLILSFSVKDVFTTILTDNISNSQLLSEGVATDIFGSNSMLGMGNKVLSEEAIKKILETDDAKKLVVKYVDISLNGLVDETSLNSVNLEDDVINFIKNNRVIFEEDLGVKFSDDVINILNLGIKYFNLSGQYKLAIQQTSASMGTTEKSLIKAFLFYTSDNFKVIASVLIVITLIIIALLQKSIYKWIHTLSVEVIINGVAIFIMAFVSEGLVNIVADGVVNFNTNALKVSAIYTFICGLILWALYIIVLKIIKNIKNGEDKNELSSQVS